MNSVIFKVVPLNLEIKRLRLIQTKGLNLIEYQSSISFKSYIKCVQISVLDKLVETN